MIEVLWAKARKGLTPIGRELVTGTLGFLERLPSKRTGMALTIGTPLLVVAWHLIALTARPAHLNDIVEGLGSTSLYSFFGNPLPNNDGDRLLFVQSTKNGYGVFLSVAGGGHRKLVHEEIYQQTVWPTETLLAWSPDDRFFAYGRRVNASWQIVVCDGESGRELAATPIASQAISGAWLSPQTLVYADQNNILLTVENSQGHWSAPKPFRYFSNTSQGAPIRNLAAFDFESVVWQQGNAILSCGKDSYEPTTIWDSTTNALLGFTYLQAQRKFLLHCEDSKGQFVMDFYPYQPDGSPSITRIETGQIRPSQLAVINDGKGYAFISSVGTSNVLAIKLDSGTPLQYLWFDQVKAFAANQNEIYVTGSRNDLPVGIFEYDPVPETMTYVVPNTEQNFYYWTNCPVDRNQTINASGETLTYYLYAPSNLTAKKKHPLVIGVLFFNTRGFQGFATDEAFANAGCYYAYVDHYQRDYSQWAQDVLTVYNELTKRPDIDANKVYLYGVSAGSGVVYELLKERPDLWRGAILFSPSYPSPSQIPFSGKRFFLDSGGNDVYAGKEGPRAPMRFQDEAVRAGALVTLLIHPGMSHTLNHLPQAERERMRQALIFLSEP